MKKTYIIPEMCVVQIQHESHLAYSGGVYGVIGGDEIGYGGVDPGGSIIPDVKPHHDIWDDEW